MAVDGGVAVVGARHYDGAETSSGAVYVFERDEAGTWGQTARLLPPDGGFFDQFGESVGIDGDVVG